MKNRIRKKLLAGWLIACVVLAGSLVAPVPAGAQTLPAPIPPYTISIFANTLQAPQGISQPDSIVQWRDSIIVGFQNHVAKDGTDGKSSTIVEFSLSGKVKRMFQVPGHNDGLRIVGDDSLWALQNEDANPNLVVIELGTGTAKQYQFAPTPHGGGYDDMVVKDGKVSLPPRIRTWTPWATTFSLPSCEPRSQGIMFSLSPYLMATPALPTFPPATPSR
jgi:hypothetical protein